MAKYNSWNSSYPNTEYPTPSLSLDVEWLKATCSVQGKSRDEGRMIVYICDQLEALGLEPKLDKNRNVYVTKGEADKYPCMVAHMDTVHSYVDNYAVAHVGNFLAAFDMDNGNQTGVGGDDRCGIHAALQLLAILPTMKAAFFVEEETGGTNGSGACYMPFFEDVTMVLQCDRRGGSDWVQTASGTKLASDEFITKITPFLQARSYEVTQNGGFTDVANLKTRKLNVCAANMSCGYYDPHSKSETIHLPTFENTLSLCYDIFLAIGNEVQPHEYVAKTYTSSYTNSYNNYKGSNKAYWSPSTDPTWTYVQGTKEGNYKNFGWVKTVDKKVLTGPIQFRDAEAFEKKYQQDLLDAQAELAKKSKKEIKDWVAKEGKWHFNKSTKNWERWHKTSKDEQFWVVALTKSILDIPTAEKEFLEDFGEGFTLWDSAQDYSEYYYEMLAETNVEVIDMTKKLPMPKEAEDESQLRFPLKGTEDKEMYFSDLGTRAKKFTCPDCSDKRVAYPSEYQEELWCDNCQAFVKAPAGSISDLTVEEALELQAAKDADDESERAPWEDAQVI